jgi:hypothetical protein
MSKITRDHGIELEALDPTAGLTEEDLDRFEQAPADSGEADH